MNDYKKRLSLYTEDRGGTKTTRLAVLVVVFANLRVKY